MPMFIQIFLMCIIAQPQFCVQPLSKEKSPVESAPVNHKSTIFSLIKNAANCTAIKILKSESNFRKLEAYCERPYPGDTPSEDTFLSYEVILCMVLYDGVQHVCREVTNGTKSFSGDFSCDNMIKGVPEACAESTEHWVTLFKAKFGNISDCEGHCMQGKIINPICEYIWKANTLTPQAQVSSAISADTSPIKNSQVNPKGHGKTNKTMTSKDKPSGTEYSVLLSTERSHHSIVNNGSQNTEQVDQKMMPADKSTAHKGGDLAEANGNRTQSGSENDMKNDVKEWTQATVTTVLDDSKELAQRAGSSTPNVIKKQVHGTNSDLQNITKKQEHAKNSSNQSAEVTPLNAQVTERTSEADKYDDSTGKVLFSDSKSNTAPQPENTSSAGDNEDSATATDKNDDKLEYTDNPIEEQEEGRLHLDHQEKQSGQIPKETETHQEEAETGNPAQFNQLGDVADSHFYAYFMTMVVICIIGYLVFHNKQKILALALEGRSRRGTRRRPNTSAYRKLDSNLEEAVTSTCSTSVTHVIY